MSSWRTLRPKWQKISESDLLTTDETEASEMWQTFNKAQENSRALLIKHLYETLAIVNMEGLTDVGVQKPPKKKRFFSNLFKR